MAVVINDSQNNFVTNATGTALLLTVAASATSALAIITFASTVPTTLTVSWNSSAQFFTQLVDVSGTAGSSNSRTQMAGLVSPAAGTFSVRWLWNGAASASYRAISFFNTPSDTIANCFPHTSSATGVSQLPSITVTSQSSNMAIGSYGALSTVDSVDNTQIDIQNSNTAKSGANRASGAASVTLGASVAASASWTAVGVDVAAAAGAAATITSFQAGSWSALPVRYSVIGAG